MPADISNALFAHSEWFARGCTGPGQLSMPGANLTGADLRGADLRGAYGSPVRWPSPTMVLMANWGRVSAELCRDLMNFDAACHPDPGAFQRWADDGDCPYADCPVERAVNFIEDRIHWDPSAPLCRPYDLMTRLIAERMRPDPAP